MTWQPAAPPTPSSELPPRVDLEAKSVLRACFLARAPLAELNAAVDLVPNRAIVINTLPVSRRRQLRSRTSLPRPTACFQVATDEAAQADLTTSPPGF